MSGDRVLVAEDDPLVSAVLSVVLAAEGLKAHMVESGHDALVAIAEDAFDIIISDLQMPEVDGIQVLRQARAQQPAARLIMISGYADEDTRRQVHELRGVLLHKPFGASDLRSLLSSQ